MHTHYMHTNYYYMHTNYYYMHTNYYYMHTNYYYMHTNYYYMHTPTQLTMQGSRRPHGNVGEGGVRVEGRTVGRVT